MRRTFSYLHTFLAEMLRFWMIDERRLIRLRNMFIGFRRWAALWESKSEKTYNVLVTSVLGALFK